MKSMREMQQDQLNKAVFDKGYPRPVVMPIGVIVLAHTEEKYKQMVRSSTVMHTIMGVVLIAMSMVVTGFVIHIFTN